MQTAQAIDKARKECAELARIEEDLEANANDEIPNLRHDNVLQFFTRWSLEEEGGR